MLNRLWVLNDPLIKDGESMTLTLNEKIPIGIIQNPYGHDFECERKILNMDCALAAVTSYLNACL